MAGHHFEVLGLAGEPHTVRCVYCAKVDHRTEEAFDQANPKPFAARIRRTTSPDEECPVAH